MPIPLDVVLIHDESAFMWRADPGLTAQRRALRRVMSLVAGSPCAAADRVGYVGFGAPHLDEAIPLRPIAGRRDRRALVDRIGAATPDRGWPDYEAALHAAADALQDGDDAYARPPYRAAGRAVGALFLSDGRLPAEAHRLQDPRPTAGHRPGTELFRSRRWPVHTIAVGSAAGDGRVSGLLRAMAESTGGRHHEAPALEDLVRIHVAIVAELGHRDRLAPIGSGAPAGGGRAWEGREV